MNYGFDRLIVSSDHSHFIQFAPIVSKAWRTLFPSLKLTLAYVTDDLSLKKDLETMFDDVLIFNNIENVPSANLAKIARRFACSLYDNEVCMIEDIDTAPLRSDYVLNYVKQRSPNTMGMVGLEVYQGTPDYGKVPASNTFAESYIWKNIINPYNFNFSEWVKSLKGLNIFDLKEDPYSHPSLFSDESLMRALIKINNVNKESITHINRNCVPFRDWIDRSWWSIDEKKLNNHEYMLVNFKRPIGAEAQPVVFHIFNFLNQ
jgi:hypothetical protein